MKDKGGVAVALFFVLVPGTPALAHDAFGDSWWSLDPWVLAGLALLAFVRPRVRWSFADAAAALFFALVWPLDVLAERSLAAHMAQHMLLIAVAAPLLVHARPSMRLLSRLPRWLFAMLKLDPPGAFLLHGATIWLVHAPLLVEWALAYRSVHIAEHIALLGTALLFCHSLARRSRYGEGAVWTLATMIHTGALGALLTMSPRLLYPGYTLDDQQLAGLIMWIPGGMVYLAIGLAFFAGWLRQAAS